MKFLNLGILAHVDAGKTSLTERLLFNAGVISQIGSVDAGNTQTDSLALEQQRGITIKTAAASFAIGDTTINLLDTPGHPDFIAEVERILDVLDGAILVISAVEGVQAQTRILMRTLQRLKIPVVIFVNKIDRPGARYDKLLDDIAQKLTPNVSPMGKVINIGKPAANFVPYPFDKKQLTDSCPVFAGSAITGAGVKHLLANLAKILPLTVSKANEPCSALIFKIDRSINGEKIAFVRMFSGVINTRDFVKTSETRQEKVTAIDTFEQGKVTRSNQITAGQIGKLWGLNKIKIGDSIGIATKAQRRHFTPPMLETIVQPAKADKK